MFDTWWYWRMEWERSVTGMGRHTNCKDTGAGRAVDINDIFAWGTHRETAKMQCVRTAGLGTSIHNTETMKHRDTSHFSGIRNSDPRWSSTLLHDTCWWQGGVQVLKYRSFAVCSRAPEKMVMSRMQTDRCGCMQGQLPTQANFQLLVSVQQSTAF